MLTVRLLQLSLLPLALLLCEDSEEVAETPVAAALVSGENSDLGKCSPYFLYQPQPQPYPVIVIRRTSLACWSSQGGVQDWVPGLGATPR